MNITVISAGQSLSPGKTSSTYVALTSQSRERATLLDVPTPLESPGDLGRLADRLCELLATSGRYRRRWMQKAQRMRVGSQINEAAVARVIAEYLRATGQIDRADADRRLKDVVYRALRGKTLTSRTLTWFIEAFNINEDDAVELWSLHTGVAQDSIELGNLRPPPFAAAAFQPPNYQTLTLIDFHQIGSGGVPVRHRTVQVVRATQDGFDRYPFRFDTSTASVEVIAGGTASDTYRIDENLYAVDILLPNPLKRSETAAFEFVVTYNYDSPPPCDFRRAALRRMDNVSIKVEFDASKVPAKVWWAVWADFREESPILTREKVELGADLSLNRHLDAIERTVVGFCWEWE